MDIFYSCLSIYLEYFCSLKLINLSHQSTKDNYLEIKFNDRNQVDDIIALWQDGGFLSFIQVLSADTIHIILTDMNIV